MKNLRIPSLLLAAALQILPLCRTVYTNPAVNSTFAIILRWGIGAAATVGAFDAASGASQVYFDCPSNAIATVGVPFTYYITLGGTIGGDGGSVVAAAPLPTGFTNYTMEHLNVPSTPNSEWGVISGTPTSTTTNLLINLAASNPNFQSGVPITGPLYLTVYPSSTAVVINTQPLDVNATNGQTVSFTVAATGTGPLTYQWFKSDTNIWNHIERATNATYTFKASTNVTSSSFRTNAGNYLVRIAGAAGMVSSTTAALTFNTNSATAPTISTQPTNQTVTTGQSATFIVAANGTAPLSYQWRFFGTNLAGATTNNFTRVSAQAVDAGSYTVVVTNTVGSVTSAVATLTVNIPPSITTPPQDQYVLIGENPTFTVLAAGTAPLSYQWRFFGTNLASATVSSFTRSNVQSNDFGNYNVVVTNVAGSITSAVATLSHVQNPILTNPLMSSGTFTFTLSGNPGRNYLIQSTTNLTGWSNVLTFSNYSGPVLFTDTNATGFFKMFRAKVAP